MISSGDALVSASVSRSPSSRHRCAACAVSIAMRTLLSRVIGVDNVASRRVAEKAGATLHRPVAAGPAYLVNLRTMLPNFSAAPYAAHVCAPEAE